MNKTTKLTSGEALEILVKVYRSVRILYQCPVSHLYTVEAGPPDRPGRWDTGETIEEAILNLYNACLRDAKGAYDSLRKGESE